MSVDCWHIHLLVDCWHIHLLQRRRSQQRLLSCRYVHIKKKSYSLLCWSGVALAPHTQFSCCFISFSLPPHPRLFIVYSLFPRTGWLLIVTFTVDCWPRLRRSEDRRSRPAVEHAGKCAPKMIEKSSYVGPASQVIVAVYFLFVFCAISAHHKIKKVLLH